MYSTLTLSDHPFRENMSSGNPYYLKWGKRRKEDVPTTCIIEKILANRVWNITTCITCNIILNNVYIIYHIFLKSNPTPEPVEGPIGHGPVTWPALTPDELNILWIHRDEIEPRINYRQRYAAFWREYISYVVDKVMYSEGHVEREYMKKVV